MKAEELLQRLKEKRAITEAEICDLEDEIDKIRHDKTKQEYRHGLITQLDNMYSQRSKTRIAVMQAKESYNELLREQKKFIRTGEEEMILTVKK